MSEAGGVITSHICDRTPIPLNVFYCAIIRANNRFQVHCLFLRTRSHPTLTYLTRLDRMVSFRQSLVLDVTPFASGVWGVGAG